MDKAFLHRVAEAAIKDFVDRVGEQLGMLVVAKASTSRREVAALGFVTGALANG